MIREVAEAIVDNSDYDVELYEDYIPRGRTSSTTAIVVERESDYWRAAADTLLALVEAECEGDNDSISPYDFRDVAFSVRVDNLGKKYIFY